MSRGSARFFMPMRVYADTLQFNKGARMAKNQNTYEKRRRETEKKFRANEKRKKREAKKQNNTRLTEGANSGREV
jgi:hypothetical protein